MRRRNKPKVVWLPQTNQNSVDTLNRSTWNIASTSITAPAAGDAVTIEAPILMDGVQGDALNDTSSLADVTASGYRLRRIVGKLYYFIAQSDIESEAIYGVTAEFIVRRTLETGGSLAAQGGSGGPEISTSDIDNAGDPWIWRRSWLLSNGPIFTTATGALATNSAAELFGRGGGSNYGRGYPGGNLEGPHVDQKTARVVGPESRLFLDVTATCILPGNGIDTSLVIIYEMRALASMRTSVGNRRNSTR